MIAWKNLDTLASFEHLSALKGKVNLARALGGDAGAQRVAEYRVPMGGGLTYHYAAKQVDEEILDTLQALAEPAFRKTVYVSAPPTGSQLTSTASASFVSTGRAGAAR